MVCCAQLFEVQHSQKKVPQLVLQLNASAEILQVLPQ
jgi:hypothetical protein